MRRRSPILLLTIFLICFFPITTQGRDNTQETMYYEMSATQTMRPRTWSNVSLLYPNQYHNYAKMLEEINQIANLAPGITDLFTIGQSFLGKNIYCLKVTNEANTDPKAGVLFVAHHHGREQITVETSLRFLIRLVNGYGIDQTITNYINSEEIYVIPTLNPDSLQYVVDEGNAWLRKNLRSFDDDGDGQFEEDQFDDTNSDGKISSYDIYEKYGNDWYYTGSYYEGTDNDNDGLVNEDNIGGVDLNRNYDFHWNDSTIDSGWGSDTSLEDYPGTAPFSELETQAFRSFLENKTFATAISLHSGINATYFPYSWTDYWPEFSLYYDIYNDFLELWPNLDDYLSNGGKTNQITHRSLPNYTVAGGWQDWMYARKNCLVPMTFEIYHNASSETLGTAIESNSTHVIYEWDEIFGYFAPVESAIDALWADVQPTFDYWLKLVPRITVTSYNVAKEGDTTQVNLTIKNLSPRVRTVENLNILDKDYLPILNNGTLVTIPQILADQEVDLSFDLALNQTISSETPYTIKIGNDFIGYFSLTLGEELKSSTIVISTFQTSTTPTTTTTVAERTPWGLLPTILAIVTLLIWYKVKKR